jgi:hypothetical protein
MSHQLAFRRANLPRGFDMKMNVLTKKLLFKYYFTRFFFHDLIVLLCFDAYTVMAYLNIHYLVVPCIVFVALEKAFR